jgi:hypothetical protein
VKAANSAGRHRAKFAVLFAVSFFVILIACEGILSCEDEEVDCDYTSARSLKYRK